MLGEPLSLCDEAPAGGAWWHSRGQPPGLPRGVVSSVAGEPLGSMEQLLFGPADEPDGAAQPVRRAAPGDGQVRLPRLKEFQKVGLILDR